MKLTFIIFFTIIFTGCSLTNSETNTYESNISTSPTIVENSDIITNDDADKNLPTYTLEEIAQHNQASDCWFAIEGSVYDVTEYIASGMHGGGPTIIEGCGKDATELFNTRPMGSGTPHSDKARSFLPNFQIGILAN